MDETLILVFLMEGGKVIASEGSLKDIRDCFENGVHFFDATDPEDRSPFIINLDQMVAIRTIDRSKVFKGPSKFTM